MLFSIIYKLGSVLTFSFLFTLIGNAQIHMCIEKNEKKDIQSSTGAGVFSYSTKWTNGSTLTVSFIGGSRYVRSKVILYAKDWERYANIHFNFEQKANPDILVSFKIGKGSWSSLGVNSKNTISNGEASMNFGWFDENTPEYEFKRTILHEFGHALGLMHEHLNPLSGIQWNKPVVYNYYFNTQGWTKEQVDYQVFQKLSVSLSNHIYDRHSIMHYPIPPEFTLNRFSVPLNTELSQGDITFIKELYPSVKLNPITPTDSDPMCSLENIELVHNVFRNKQIGMVVNISFTMKNGANNQFSASAYFYFADGTPLRDNNNSYNTYSGTVATTTYFSPVTNNQRYQQLELFIPYNELELANGKFDLKSSISIWTKTGKELIQSGSYYFIYSKGVMSNNLQLLTNFNNYTNTMEITPQFDITNAQNLLCTACVYFFFEDGTPISIATFDNYSICHDFIPAYYSTLFNYQYNTDFLIPVPYHAINIPAGTYQLKYYVALFNNGNQFKTSTWYYATFTR